MKSPRKISEKEIQRTIISYLELKRVFHYRQNSGAFKTEAGGFYRMGINGAPDLVCVVDGRYIGLEIKSARGVLNDNQRAFQERLERAGGRYLIIRSLDDVINAKIGE